MSGTTLAVGIVLGVRTLVVGYAAVGAAAVGGQKVAAAVDAAALAAADTALGFADGAPCDRAAEIAGRGGAVVVSCAIDGTTATVTVSARLGPVEVRAAARAGVPRPGLG